MSQEPSTPSENTSTSLLIATILDSNISLADIDENTHGDICNEILRDRKNAASLLPHLISKGFNVNRIYSDLITISDFTKRTFLIRAVELHAFEAANALLELNISDLKFEIDGFTIFQAMANLAPPPAEFNANECLKLIKTLQAKGCDINKGDPSPLVFAIVNCNIELANLFIECKADINKSTRTENTHTSGGNMFHQMCSLPLDEDPGKTIELLKKLGLDINQLDSSEHTPLEVLLLTSPDKNYLESFINHGAVISSDFLTQFHQMLNQLFNEAYENTQDGNNNDNNSNESDDETDELNEKEDKHYKLSVCSYTIWIWFAKRQLLVNAINMHDWESIKNIAEEKDAAYYFKFKLKGGISVLEELQSFFNTTQGTDTARKIQQIINIVTKTSQVDGSANTTTINQDNMEGSTATITSTTSTVSSTLTNTTSVVMSSLLAEKSIESIKMDGLKWEDEIIKNPDMNLLRSWIIDYRIDVNDLFKKLEEKDPCTFNASGFPAKKYDYKIYICINFLFICSLKQSLLSVAFAYNDWEVIQAIANERDAVCYFNACLEDGTYLLEQLNLLLKTSDEEALVKKVKKTLGIFRASSKEAKTALEKIQKTQGLFDITLSSIEPSSDNTSSNSSSTSSFATSTGTSLTGNTSSFGNRHNFNPPAPANEQQIPSDVQGEQKLSGGLENKFT